MGIDVSHYQGDINWHQVRDAGHSFAFCKATQGVVDADPAFVRNMEGMKAEGIIRGAYCYMVAGVDVQSQIDFFIHTVKASGYDFATEMPLVLDIEDPNGLTLEEVISASDIIKKYTGKLPILYFSPGYWDQWMNGSDGMAGHFLWIADYKSPDLSPEMPQGFTKWIIWQYSQSGEVPGVSGNVDLDKFNGDSIEEFKKEFNVKI